MDRSTLGLANGILANVPDTYIQYGLSSMIRDKRRSNIPGVPPGEALYFTRLGEKLLLMLFAERFPIVIGPASIGEYSGAISILRQKETLGCFLISKGLCSRSKGVCGEIFTNLVGIVYKYLLDAQVENAFFVVKRWLLDNWYFDDFIEYVYEIGSPGCKSGAFPKNGTRSTQILDFDTILEAPIVDTNPIRCKYIPTLDDWSLEDYDFVPSDFRFSEYLLTELGNLDLDLKVAIYPTENSVSVAFYAQGKEQTYLLACRELDDTVEYTVQSLFDSSFEWFPSLKQGLLLQTESLF